MCPLIGEHLSQHLSPLNHLNAAYEGYIYYSQVHLNYNTIYTTTAITIYLEFYTCRKQIARATAKRICFASRQLTLYTSTYLAIIARVRLETAHHICTI